MTKINIEANRESGYNQSHFTNQIQIECASPLRIQLNHSRANSKPIQINPLSFWHNRYELNLFTIRVCCTESHWK
jgi:hypothetical protein